jgi:hypothetical protein
MVSLRSSPVVTSLDREKVPTGWRNVRNRSNRLVGQDKGCDKKLIQKTKKQKKEEKLKMWMR